MNAIEIFFGPTARDVMAQYRRIQYGRRAIEALDIHLKRLREERALWHNRDKAEIAKREGRVAEKDSELARANEAAVRLNQKVRRMTEAIDAWWKRLGIYLVRIFSKHGSSVQELRAQIASMSKNLSAAEQKIEQLLVVRVEQAVSLRELAEPIASHDYAIGFLENQRESTTREMKDANQAVLLALRATVRSMTPHALQTRVVSLSGKPELAALTDEVLQLKSILAELDAWSEAEETIELVLDVSDTCDRILSGIQDGLGPVDGAGAGSIVVKGQGTSHVQKTRTRTETTRDSNGRTSTRRRTETYWDRVNVTFSGEVRVGFPVSYTRWSSEAVAETLKQEADRWFKAGHSRQLQGEAAKSVKRLEQRADTLTRQIRRRLEAYVSG